MLPRQVFIPPAYSEWVLAEPVSLQIDWHRNYGFIRRIGGGEPPPYVRGERPRYPLTLLDGTHLTYKRTYQRAYQHVDWTVLHIRQVPRGTVRYRGVLTITREQFNTLTLEEPVHVQFAEIPRVVPGPA